MDIRSRCDYILNKKDFKKCQARIDTAIFMFDNDYSFYTMMENAKNMRSKNAIIRKYLLKVIKLTRQDTNKAIELYWKNQENDYCECCDTFCEVEKINGIICCKKCDNFECKLCGLINTHEDGYPVEYCEEVDKCICDKCKSNIIMQKVSQ